MKTVFGACAALAFVTIAAPAFAGMGVNGPGTNGATASTQALVSSATLLPTGERISLR